MRLSPASSSSESILPISEAFQRRRALGALKHLLLKITRIGSEAGLTGELSRILWF
jgi:hypothetical protein